MAPAAYLQSAAGAAFDGAASAGSAVYFPVDRTAAVAATTLSVPAGVNTVLITGLAPNATYDTSVYTGATGTIINLATGSAIATDSAGVLMLTF